MAVKGWEWVFRVHNMMDFASYGVISTWPYLERLEGRENCAGYNQFIQHTLRTSQDTDIFWARKLEGSKMTSIVRKTEKNSRPMMNTSIIRKMPLAFKRPGDMSFAVVLKAAWSLVLSILSRSRDATFGSLVSGRNAGFGRSPGCRRAMPEFRS